MHFLKKELPMNTTSGKNRIWLKCIIAVTVALLCLANMGMIFAFSAENGEESGNRSAGVTDVVVRLLHPDFDELDEEEADRVLTSTHHFVRKAAHFSEFALLGVLSTALALFLLSSFPALKLKYWMTLVFPPLLCLLYAVSDEVHQIFSGRGPRVTDVLIDFAGAVTGFLLAQGISYLIRALIRSRKEKP